MEQKERGIAMIRMAIMGAAIFGLTACAPGYPLPDPGAQPRGAGICDTGALGTQYRILRQEYDITKKKLEKKKSNKQKENVPIPPELLAGAGGAVAGGAAGYALAPALGLSRGVGTLGGGALTALASALLANKLKQRGEANA